MPIAPKDVPHLDAVLITHCDNDHYSVPTCTEMSSVCREYHSTFYVDSLMETQGLNSFGHRIGETFNVGPISIKLTRLTIRGKMSIRDIRVNLRLKIIVVSS